MAKHFNIAVIGTGPGGYIAALKAAQMGAKTAVIEKSHLGGTCLNHGCIPSKALLASAELMHRIHSANSLGITIDGTINFNWRSIQKRKDGILRKLRNGIKSLLALRKVDMFNGTAKLVGTGKIQIIDTKGGSQIITADKIIIASGSIPSKISSLPDNPEYVCTSDAALHWHTLPKRLLIIGGGVIGCEFACMMNEYGVKVTIVEMLDQLLPEMESDLGRSLAEVFSKRGIAIHCNVKVEDLSTKNSLTAIISNGQQIEVDKILVATGRKPNTTDLGLDTIGLATDRGFIRVNNKMETAVPDYYCIGDANGRCLLAHAASAQGIVAVKNALGANIEQTLPVPSVVYTFPEIASVGMTTQQARTKKIPIKIGQFPIRFLGKAMAVGANFGFVRVIRHSEDGTLLGVHIIGHNATEIISAAAAMLSLRVGTKDLCNLIFAHPTLSEAVKEAAEDSFQSALHLPPSKLT